MKASEDVLRSDDVVCLSTARFLSGTRGGRNRSINETYSGWSTKKTYGCFVCRERVGTLLSGR